jgi:TrpR-related protein YerC/YecD
MAKTKETPALLKDDHEAVLFAALASLKSADEMRRFLTDLCTRQEIAAFSERLLIARLLQQGGWSYREISAMTGASTTTIGRVARYLEQEPHQGYRLVLGRKK